MKQNIKNLITLIKVYGFSAIKKKLNNFSVIVY